MKLDGEASIVLRPTRGCIKEHGLLSEYYIISIQMISIFFLVIVVFIQQHNDKGGCGGKKAILFRMS